MSAAVIPQETINQYLQMLGDPRVADALRKATTQGITQTTGLVYFDLRGPAKSTYPVLTPIRNVLPRRPGRGGTAVNWRAITAINTTTIPAGVSEGNRNAFMSLSEVDFTRAYRGIGGEMYTTFEADYAAENFDDVKAKAALIGLQATMISEEYGILGGNTSLALGTTPTPALSASTTGGNIGSVTVSVKCVALTPDGFRYASLASGIQQQIVRTNADGSTDTINGGTAQPSAEATIAATGPTASVTATVAQVPGAVAYAWFVGSGAGNEKIAGITTTTQFVATTIPGSGQAASGLTASDFSKDALMFDGLLTYAFNAANGGYFSNQNNTTLTSDGAAGIVEINNVFAFYWNNFRLHVDEIWCHAQEQQDITAKVIAGGGTPLFRLNLANGADNGAVEAGARVTQLLNPITGQKCALNVHPYMPAGTILGRIKTLPPGTYPNSNIGETVEMETRRDYYQIQWPITRRRYEFGVYADLTPIVWAPFVLSAITNIKQG